MVEFQINIPRYIIAKVQRSIPIVKYNNNFESTMLSILTVNHTLGIGDKQ